MRSPLAPLALRALPRRAFTVLVSLAVPSAGSAQMAVPTIHDSYSEARRLVDKAIAAHGGPDALQRAERMRITLDGEDIWRNQSQRVAPPYDRRPARVDLRIDVPASRLSFRTSATYPGDLHNSARLVVDGQRAHRIMEGMGVHRVDRPSVVATNSVSLTYVPQLLLAQAEKNAGSLRALGRIALTSGTTVNAVAFNISNGAMMTVGFDPGSGLLRAIVTVQNDPLTGIAEQVTEFPDYREVDGLLLPTMRIARMAGETTQELHYRTAVVDYAIPDSSLAIPAGSVPLDRTAPTERVRQVAPGIYRIWVFGVWILAATMADHTIVFEAPGGSATEVMAQLARVAPGKPVRYVVLTHHHDDHTGGVREYVEAGATLVTTAGNRKYFARMVAASPSVGNSRPASPAPAVRIETIAEGGRRVFTDGKVTVEVHHAGGNRHVDEMLVGWIPTIGTVIEADMINVAPNGAIPSGVNIEALRTFASWLEGRPWQVRNFMSLHYPDAPASVLDEILRQPAMER